MHFEETSAYLIAHDVQVENTFVNVVIERQALPPYANDETRLSEWVENHALGAVQNNDMGDHRYFDNYPNNQCGWIYRILHNNDDISINKAPEH